MYLKFETINHKASTLYQYQLLFKDQQLEIKRILLCRDTGYPESCEASYPVHLRIIRKSLFSRFFNSSVSRYYFKFMILHQVSSTFISHQVLQKTCNTYKNSFEFFFMGFYMSHKRNLWKIILKIFRIKIWEMVQITRSGIRRSHQHNRRA